MNKFNAERRHHIPKLHFRVTNWAEYEAGLRRRGNLTLRVTEEAWNAAPRATPGRAGDLFRQRDPDLPDAAHGVQTGIASIRRIDDVGRRVAGLRAGRARPHVEESESGSSALCATLNNSESITDARARVPLSAEHKLVPSQRRAPNSSRRDIPPCRGRSRDTDTSHKVRKTRHYFPLR
jgi:hypothetical protein